MANDITQVPISGLEGASAASAQDLLEIAKVNAQAETGYKTLIGAINELKQRVDALEG